MVPDSPPVPARQRGSDGSLRRRLEAVNAEVRRLRQENQRLRQQLAWALGERCAARHPGRSGSTMTRPCS
jgi:hypothetical protein